MNTKTLRKRLARTIHLAAGWIVSLLGYCPRCLNEAPDSGAVCPTCVSSFHQLGRRVVFKFFCMESEPEDQDAQVHMCPECGHVWVADNYETAEIGHVMCPKCEVTYPSLYRVRYNCIEIKCPNCGTFFLGAVPATYEWLKCGACGEKIPAPVEPVT